MERVKRVRNPTGRHPWSLATATLAVGAILISTHVTSAGAASNHGTKNVVVSTTKNAKLGTILVSSGNTVYTLKASTTRCSGQCLKIWPEVLLPKNVKHARAGTGVKSANLGTIRRRGGALQVTYSGKPLYRFSGDKSAGQANGDVTDTWGTWSVVTTTPTKTPSPAPSNTPATSSTTPTTTTRSTSPTPTTAPTPSSAPTPATMPPVVTTPSTSPPPSPTTTPPTTTPPTTTPTTAPSTGGVSF